MEIRTIPWPQLQSHRRCLTKTVPFPLSVSLVLDMRLCSRDCYKKEPVGGGGSPNDPSKATFLAKSDSSSFISGKMPVVKDCIVK